MATKTTDELRHGVGAWWQSVVGEVTDGWDRLRQSAATAVTRFRPDAATGMPAAHEVDDAGYTLAQGWSMLGADVFDDDARVVVRLEAPGMSKADFRIDVDGQALVVRGSKHFERESTAGRWRMVQCAYGAFQRRVPLPVVVQADHARATYRDGVLRIELPKATPAAPASTSVAVD